MSKAKIPCLSCGAPRGHKGAKGLCVSCYHHSRYKAGVRTGLEWRASVTGTCTVDGCEKPIHPNGFKLQMCNMHSLRMRRNGTLEITRRSPNTMTPEERAAEIVRLRAQDYERHADAYRARAKRWSRANPARAAMSGRKRQLCLEQRTPAWLTEAQWAEMNKIYGRAWSLVKTTGIKHEVDHIVPLRHKLASGLHVPVNLAIAAKTANRKKSNAADLDQIAADQMRWLRERGLSLGGGAASAALTQPGFPRLPDSPG